MTEDEIRRSYRQAKNPKRQIGVLADLNDCNRQEIEKICGVDDKEPRMPEKKKSPETEKVITRLYDRLDEIDRLISTLEEEYVQTIIEIKVIGGL